MVYTIDEILARDIRDVEVAADDVPAHDLYEIAVSYEVAHDMRIDQPDATKFIVSLILAIGWEAGSVEPLSPHIEPIGTEISKNHAIQVGRCDPLRATCRARGFGLAPFAQAVLMKVVPTSLAECQVCAHRIESFVAYGTFAFDLFPCFLDIILKVNGMLAKQVCMHQERAV